MRNTRVMTWILLVLSAAFFFMRDFRSALRLAMMEVELRRVNGTDLQEWVARMRTFGVQQDQLRTLAQRAEGSGNAEALAFAALHLNDAGEAFRAGDKAVALNQKLTWIGYDLLTRHPGSPSVELRRESDQWIARLEAFDPQDALPWVVKATELAARNPNFAQVKWNNGVPDPSPLAIETEWLAAMEKAFSQPHFHSRDLDRFLLERTVLRQQGWDTAPEFLGTTAAETIPNLFGVRTYANYKCFYLAGGAKSESERLRQYRETSAFGKLMVHENGPVIGILIGIAIDHIGGQELAKRLEATGNKAEALLVRQGLLQTRDMVGLYASYALRRPATNAVWARVLYPLLTALIGIFGALTVLTVLYVQLKSVRGGESKGLIYQLATVGQNYFPILLFAACVGLFLVNCPYANNFHHYMTVQDPAPVLGIVDFDTFPLHEPFLNDENIPLYTGLSGFGIAAAVGLVLVFVGARLAKGHSGRQAWRARA
jgi:hypothetical protein